MLEKPRSTLISQKHVSRNNSPTLFLPVVRENYFVSRQSKIVPWGVPCTRVSISKGPVITLPRHATIQKESIQRRALKRGKWSWFGLCYSTLHWLHIWSRCFHRREKSPLKLNLQWQGHKDTIFTAWKLQKKSSFIMNVEESEWVQRFDNSSSSIITSFTSKIQCFKVRCA